MGGVSLGRRHGKLTQVLVASLFSPGEHSGGQTQGRTPRLSTPQGYAQGSVQIATRTQRRATQGRHTGPSVAGSGALARARVTQQGRGCSRGPVQDVRPLHRCCSHRLGGRVCMGSPIHRARASGVAQAVVVGCVSVGHGVQRVACVSCVGRLAEPGGWSRGSGFMGGTGNSVSWGMGARAEQRAAPYHRGGVRRPPGPRGRPRCTRPAVREQPSGRE